MNPYEIDLEKLGESKEIKDEKDLLKLRLLAEFWKISSKMDSREVLERTGLHKSDLSRLKGFDVSRFTIDRLVTILDKLGYSTILKVKAKKAS